MGFLWDFLRLHLTACSRERQSENSSSERKKRERKRDSWGGGMSTFKRCSRMSRHGVGETWRKRQAFESAANGSKRQVSVRHAACQACSELRFHNWSGLVRHLLCLASQEYEEEFIIQYHIYLPLFFLLSFLATSPFLSFHIYSVLYIYQWKRLHELVIEDIMEGFLEGAAERRYSANVPHRYEITDLTAALSRKVKRGERTWSKWGRESVTVTACAATSLSHTHSALMASHLEKHSHTPLSVLWINIFSLSSSRGVPAFSGDRALKEDNII